MKLTRDTIYETAKKLSNWGRWGKDDQIGTLNNIEPSDIIAAAGLIRKGKVFALGLSLKEPIQSGLFGGRWNPVHQMLATGTDAAIGKQDGDGKAYLRYADDGINMPCQASTQWDALAHIFLDDKMYNGYDATEVTVQGAAKLGIENVRDKMVGRGSCSILPGTRDWIHWKMDMPLPMMILRPVPRPRVSKFVRVILSLYAPVTRSGVWLKAIGLAMPVAMPRDWPLRPPIGSVKLTSLRSVQIHGDARCAPMKQMKQTSPGTGW